MDFHRAVDPPSATSREAREAGPINHGARSLWPAAARHKPLDLGSFFAGLMIGGSLCPLCMVGLWAITR